MKHLHWKKEQHEAGVERFYGTGAENFGDYHGGYLNFGLWEKGINNYLDAAENLVKRVGTTLGLNKESRLLDVACGMGTQDILLHKTSGSKIDAVDVTRKHVQWAQKRINKAELNTHIRAHHGNATDLPFDKNTFTHVMSIEGPGHFDTREKFFHEAHRVLKKGGRMVVTDYVLIRKPKNLWERFIILCARRLWHVPKANEYDLAVYKKKVHNAGFKNTTIKQIGKNVIPGYYFEQRKPETRRKLMKIRGWFAAYPGHIIDILMYKIFKDGLVEYILVRAEK